MGGAVKTMNDAGDFTKLGYREGSITLGDAVKLGKLFDEHNLFSRTRQFSSNLKRKGVDSDVPLHIIVNLAMDGAGRQDLIDQMKKFEEMPPERLKASLGLLGELEKVKDYGEYLAGLGGIVERARYEPSKWEGLQQ